MEKYLKATNKEKNTVNIYFNTYKKVKKIKYGKELKTLLTEFKLIYSEEKGMVEIFRVQTKKSSEKNNYDYYLLEWLNELSNEDQLRIIDGKKWGDDK